MKAVLCGYNWIGCNILDQLRNGGYEVFVFTHQSPYHINDLEAYCKKKAVPYSLARISVDNLPFQPDVIISAYYRYIISKEIIQVVSGRIFNLHPSLLPRYRGCSSVTWALVNGEKYSGFSYHYVDSGIDSGNIIVQRKVKIEDYDTQVTLYHRMMFEAAKEFMTVLNLVLSDYQGIPQDSALATEYYKRGAPFNGVLDPAWDDERKDRFIRAMIYPPLRPATLDGRSIWRPADLLGSDDL